MTDHVRPDLEAITARADAATEGPWFREYGDVVLADDDPRDQYDDEPRYARVVRAAEHHDLRAPQALADATFIAESRTDVPALVNYARELRDENAQLRDVLKEVRSFHYEDGLEDGIGPVCSYCEHAWSSGVGSLPRGCETVRAIEAALATSEAQR